MPKRYRLTELVQKPQVRLQSFAGRFLNKKTLILLASLALSICGVLTWRIKQQAEERLAAERALLEKQDLIPFEKKSYAPITSKAVTIWQSSKNTRALARFNDAIFVATDGGLIELGPAGNLVRRYTVLDGLPESDLLSLAAFNSRLFIGTRTQGLVSFDGNRFEGYRWTDRTPQSIDVLLADTGRLLIGTRAAGLITFDGRQFKEITAGPGHKRLLEVTLLSKNGGRLLVGTFGDGLWILEGARWLHFTTADGLLSNRIVGVAGSEQYFFVAADYGLTVAPLANLSTEPSEGGQARFLSLATLPALSSMVKYGSRLVFSKDNGETFDLPVPEDISRLRQIIPATWNRTGDLAESRLVILDQDLWLLSNDGLRRANVDQSHLTGGPSSTPFSSWGQFAAHCSLTSNLVSALSFDRQGRLWVGSFRNGIDVLSPQGLQLGHIESEEAREINFLTEDQSSKTMLAAGSAGLLRFNLDLRPTERWSTSDGLLSNSVLQVAHLNVEEEDSTNPRLVCATSKGLSVGLRGKLRALTTVQGLPSNSLYTVLVLPRKTYVGTLGGLAVLEDGRVTRVFKDTNSKLTPNWVSALRAIGPRVFVGSYGGGVFELNPSGDLRSFSTETGRAVVNPNAMWSDDSRLYVGTLNGAYIFDLDSQQWTSLKSQLPSTTVLSITGDDRYVYFGTTSGIARIERRYWSSEG